jgi:hypothetical protein
MSGTKTHKPEITISQMLLIFYKMRMYEESVVHWPLSTTISPTDQCYSTPYFYIYIVSVLG